MSIVLELSPEAESRLEARAASERMSKEEFARQLIEKEINRPLTGAELVAYWRAHGLIGDWADREDIKDSSEYARELRRQAETRTHE